MDSTLEAQDRAVRIAVYEHTVERSVPPCATELTERCDLPDERARESLEKLAAARWRRPSPEEAEALIASLGLAGPFWSLR